MLDWCVPHISGLVCFKIAEGEQVETEIYRLLVFKPIGVGECKLRNFQRLFVGRCQNRRESHGAFGRERGRSARFNA